VCTLWGGTKQFGLLCSMPPREINLSRKQRQDVFEGQKSNLDWHAAASKLKSILKVHTESQLILSQQPQELYLIEHAGIASSDVSSLDRRHIQA